MALGATAAALLALTIGLHASADRTQNALLSAVGEPPATGEAFPALREIATEQEIRLMELMRRVQPAEVVPAEVPVWP